MNLKNSNDIYIILFYLKGVSSVMDTEQVPHSHTAKGRALLWKDPDDVNHSKLLVEKRKAYKCLASHSSQQPFPGPVFSYALSQIRNICLSA